ncbi:hypothetical protein [Antrihabitans sp. YC2-6]|uniref:hypothetical protein n=1 Tax=Antrihabitans sp. YC2-6 TaxID=2799498 RepID=UPI0018F525FC|nr:hypothetical protein [Antrihabitans sp. YC2-6]MBJ8344326.1 hypothetical protein [Antrihabitans sp. YC2-6]
MSERLSVPEPFRIPRPLTAAEVDTLHAIADVLVPAAGDDPAATSDPDFDAALKTALNARSDAFDAITAVLEELHGSDAAKVEQSLRTMHAERSEVFQALSAVVAGAWLLSPQVTKRIGYPGQGRFPAAFDDAANELSSGILDPVLERGSVFTPAPREKS